MALKGSLTAGYWYADDGTSRGYTLSWTATQSIAKNQSTIKWSVSTAGTYKYDVAERTLKVTLGGKTLIDKTDRVMRDAGEVASGSFTLTHNTNGALSISGSIKAAVYGSTVNCDKSDKWSLDTIPRQANISTAPNFNDEGNPTITYSNPAGSAVTSLQACISNSAGTVVYAAYRNISKTGTSYTFNLTDTERDALRVACNKANSMKVKFYVTTVIGGNTYYSTLDKTLSIINATPTFTSSVKDTGGASTLLTGNNKTMIKGFNYIDASMTATAYKGATIKTYKITNGANVINSSSGGFNNAESNKFLFEVWDSRGNHNSYTHTLSMVDYTPLTCNADGVIGLSADTAAADLTVKLTGNYFNGNFGAVDNELTVEFTIATTDGAAIYQNTAPVTLNNNTYSYTELVSGLDYRQAYVIYAKAVDKINTVNISSQSLKAFPLFDWSNTDFNFNIPIAFNNVIMADFITEQGVSDIWVYRKWSSGIAECYGSLSKASHEIASGNSTMPADTNYIKLKSSFPSGLFNSKPIVTATSIDSGTGVCTANVDLDTTKDTCIVFEWGRADAFGNVNVTAIGRWK